MPRTFKAPDNELTKENPEHDPLNPKPFAVLSYQPHMQNEI